jgi:hypothetical protein
LSDVGPHWRASQVSVQNRQPMPKVVSVVFKC